MVDFDLKILIGIIERYIVFRYDVLFVGKKYKLICCVKNEGELCSICKEVKKVLCF